MAQISGSRSQESPLIISDTMKRRFMPGINFKIGHKIGGGYLIVVMLLFLVAGTGFWGLKQVGDVLDFVIGPARDTKDGAMETSIAGLSQMVAVQEMAQGNDIEENMILVKEKEHIAADGKARFVAADLLPESLYNELNSKDHNFDVALEDFLAASADFVAAGEMFDAHTGKFLAFFEQVDEIGARALQELETQPRHSTSSNDGLGDPWLAAGSAMEARIEYLEQLYYLNRLLAGASISRTRDQINEHLADQKLSVSRMFASGYYDAPADIVGYEGLSVAEAYSAMLAEHQNLLAEYIDKYIAYDLYKDVYGQSADNFFKFLARVKATGDSAVERRLESIETVKQSAIKMMSMVLVLGGILAILIAIMNTRSIIKPIRLVTDGAEHLSIGDFRLLGMDQADLTRINARTDEMGDIGRAFARLVEYLQEKAQAAGVIADGDLTTQIEPKSDMDSLGHAFVQMTQNLQELIRRVTENAHSVNSAAEQLSNAAEQSSIVTSQVADSMQHVATSISQQTQAINDAVSSVDHVSRAIDGIARGAHEQASSVTQSSQITAQMSADIQQVTENAQAGAQEASEATRVAIEGSSTVEQNLQAMYEIREKVDYSVAKVHLMGERSTQIGGIVKTIEDIASQTNLLSLNAAIEAARSESRGTRLTSAMLEQHLLGVAHLVATLVRLTDDSFDTNMLRDLAQRSNVETINISDDDGVITNSNIPERIGYRFPEDKNTQAGEFRELIEISAGVVVQPILRRDTDGKPYRFVGISRYDQKGIIQIGKSAEEIAEFSNFAGGFTVIAAEVRKLAEQSTLATKDVAGLIKGMQDTVAVTVQAMDQSADEVENGVLGANEAGKALTNIMDAARVVNQQVDEIAGAAQHMSISAHELVDAMDAVSAVVEENTAATEEMNASSTIVTQAIENIASISEENGASAEEVSASTEEMSAQAEEVAASAASLAEMAQGLLGLVAQFKLEIHEGEVIFSESHPDDTLVDGNDILLSIAEENNIADV